MNKCNRACAPGVILFVVMALGCIAILNGQYANAERSTVPAQPVRRPAVTTPSPGEFPIVASTSFNRNTGPRKGDAEGMVECGFNLCMNSSTPEYFEKALDYMKGTGLKLLPHSTSFRYNDDEKDDKWKKELVSFVNRFKDNPLVAGWNFVDEPQWSRLSACRERYDLLLETDSTHFVLFNLVGEIVKSHTGPCKTLGEYLDSIQNRFDLDVWSSDCYPIWIRNGKFLVRYNEFYTDLEAFAQKSKQTGIPMWSYCESMAFTSKHHDIPAATLSHLTFEAFSALAYGAQGIVYWTYYTRPSNSIEKYISALVDLDGRKTPAWYAAQSVNRQIRALTNVFLGAEMVEVRHTGNIAMKDTRAVIENFGPVSRLTNGEKGVLASLLRNGDKDYLLIVNHDVEGMQRARLSFKPDAVVSELKVAASGHVTRKKVRGVHNATLDPGGYALFEWER